MLQPLRPSRLSCSCWVLWGRLDPTTAGCSQGGSRRLRQRASHAGKSVPLLSVLISCQKGLRVAALLWPIAIALGHSFATLQSTVSDLLCLLGKSRWQLTPVCLILSCRAFESSTARRPSRDAIVLDMGLYETPLCMLPPTATLPADVATQRDSSRHSYARSLFKKQKSLGGQYLPAGRSMSFMSGASSRMFGTARLRSETGQSYLSDSSANSVRAAAGCGHVRLYQLVAPQLARRAVVFGSKLALCPTWRCLDPPYFSAPGAC